MTVYRYGRWDDSQDLFPFDEGEVMDQLSESLLSRGDLTHALQSLVQRGMHTADGPQLSGVQDLLEQLRSARQATLDRYDLESLIDDIRRELEEIVAAERAGIERRLEEAQERTRAADDSASAVTPDEATRLLDLLERLAVRSRETLDGLPNDVGASLRQLGDYEFMDPGAKASFDDLRARLNRQLLRGHLRELAQRFQDLTPEKTGALREMLEHLNEMLEERLRGNEPEFQRFMDEYGEAFGDDPPSSLDDLVDRLRAQVAQLQALMESLSPPDRQALEDLLDASINDADLRGELSQLARNLDALAPLGGLRGEYPLHGTEPVQLDEALPLMERLQRLDELERQLGQARQSGSLDQIDRDELRSLLGPEAERGVEQLDNLTQVLEDSGYMRRTPSGYELTPRGVRRIGQKALSEIFACIKQDRLGSHPSHRRGAGADQGDDTKRYEFGDPFLVHLERTLMNAVERVPGVPVELRPADFEVYRSQHMPQASTVLMLDLSLSMAMKGSFLAAKKVALALNDLIQRQFPRDHLYIVGFATYARELKAATLPYLSWDEFDPYTNMQHGFAVSQKLLAKERTGNRQIIMISDGEPTAHMESGRLYLGYPPSPRTLQQTLREVKRCTERGIVINTFMLDRSTYLVEFISQLTKINRGRVFYTSAEKLGQYLLVDYLTAKRRRVLK